MARTGLGGVGCQVGAGVRRGGRRGVELDDEACARNCLAVGSWVGNFGDLDGGGGRRGCRGWKAVATRGG